jgi:hypothetical protein
VFSTPPLSEQNGICGRCIKSLPVVAKSATIRNFWFKISKSVFFLTNQYQISEQKQGKMIFFLLCRNGHEPVKFTPEP